MSLKVEGLQFAYRGWKVLKGVDFSWHKESLCAYWGKMVQEKLPCFDAF